MAPNSSYGFKSMSTATPARFLPRFLLSSARQRRWFIHTSVFVVVGREEGPFSAPKALEAPMGELGPEPGALLVGVESTKHQAVTRVHAHTRHTHMQGLRIAGCSFRICVYGPVVFHFVWLVSTNPLIPELSSCKESWYFHLFFLASGCSFSLPLFASVWIVPSGWARMLKKKGKCKHLFRSGIPQYLQPT